MRLDEAWTKFHTKLENATQFCSAGAILRPSSPTPPVHGCVNDLNAVLCEPTHERHHRVQENDRRGSAAVERVGKRPPSSKTIPKGLGIAVLAAAWDDRIARCRASAGVQKV